MKCTLKKIATNAICVVWVCLLVSGCSTQSKRLEAEQNAPIGSTGSTADDEQASETDDGPDAQPSQIEMARDAERALNMFLRDQKVLFAKGESEFELNLQHSTDTQNNVRLGEIIVPVLSRNATSLSFRMRYALTDNLELSVLLPATHVKTEVDYAFLTPQENLADTQLSGLGDVQAGLRYQLFREIGSQPDLALSLLYKADTADPDQGTGDQSIGLGVTVVRTIDPAVFFAQTDYTYTLPVDEVDRGDQIGLQFGTGFSLNDRVGYNVTYRFQFSERTDIDDIAIRGTSRNSGSLQFGVTVQLSRDVYLEPTLSVGMTDDAPDSQVSISLSF